MINAISKNLLSFIKNSPSPFHSVASIKKVLKREGFIELNESNEFKVELAGKYFVTRFIFDEEFKFETLSLNYNSKL